MSHLKHESPSSPLIPSITTTLFFILIFLVFLHSFHCHEDELFKTCGRTYICGTFENIKYPFWGDEIPLDCGLPGFELKCENKTYPVIKIDALDFRVLEINQINKTMQLTRTDLWDGVCINDFMNTTLTFPLFNYTSASKNISIFYNCSIANTLVGVSSNFTCPINDVVNSSTLAFYGDESFQLKDGQTCETNVMVPVLGTKLEGIKRGDTTLVEALRQGFEVVYLPVSGTICSVCESSGGICGSNTTSLTFMCLCRDQAYTVSCPIGKSLSRGLKLGLGFGAAGVCLVLMLIIFFICQRRNGKKHVSTSYVSQNTSSNYSSMADLEKMGNAFGVNIFTYSELVEATNNFDTNKELGDGGFGTVYYGKLKDGRVVAVKRLYENNFKRVEQFLNEVEILTRLRHQNLVLLYGCTSRHSQELLLVYEYIPNGTVADHLHGERIKPGCPIPWATRLKIAIETASALAYLHASDVIHRDVKSNNILLDNNFCVKVADFGLSRLFPTDVTHVSTAPQGTPGYVDPDYHQCYQLTDKSDVYSFGVVMIELISSKPAVDITRHRHEINLSNMAINKIQNGEVHELVDISLGYELDRNIHKMMNAVAELAFQCLQSDKDLRPSMKEVLKTLIEIQSDAQNAVKPKDVDDDVVPINNGNLAFSPDSVTVKWTSSYTTLSSSG